jgi:hypothetical protein
MDVDEGAEGERVRREGAGSLGRPPCLSAQQLPGACLTSSGGGVHRTTNEVFRGGNMHRGTNEGYG